MSDTFTSHIDKKIFLTFFCWHLIFIKQKILRCGINIHETTIQQNSKIKIFIRWTTISLHQPRAPHTHKYTQKKNHSHKHTHYPWCEMLILNSAFVHIKFFTAYFDMSKIFEKIKKKKIFFSFYIFLISLIPFIL